MVIGYNLPPKNMFTIKSYQDPTIS